MNKTLILHLPVIHRGYLDLIDHVEPNEVFILGPELIAEFPYLERDMRAVTPVEAKRMLAEIGGFLRGGVNILNHQGIDFLRADKFLLVMPKEDVMFDLVKKYFPDKEICWEDCFLRWNKWNAGVKSKVNPGHVVSGDEFDRQIMAEAFACAKSSPDWWRQVGVVVVKDVKVLYSTYNHHLPTERSVYIDGDPRSSFNAGEQIDLSCALHGERDAIAWAAKHGVSLDGTSLYITTFPCPGCARGIAMAGIKKVFYAEGYSLLDAEDILKTYDVAIVRVE